jgi:[NiFe] hydrogenase assembly HybE family chaperone
MAELEARVAALETVFRKIAGTRMAGLPLLNTRLKVQALGFEEQDDVACGVLVTPWFMNLVRLPLADAAQMLPPLQKAERDVGPRRFEFIGAHEPGFGAFEASSLFSPMFEFEDQAAALATACEVLGLLRPAPAVPSRRGFLFGRTAA